MNDKQVISEFLAAYAAAQPRDGGEYDRESAIKAGELIPAVTTFLRTQPAQAYEMSLYANGGEISITVRIGRAEPVEYATKQDVIDAMREMTKVFNDAIHPRREVDGGLPARSGTAMQKIEVRDINHI
jgi:hypothetical protein